MHRLKLILMPFVLLLISQQAKAQYSTGHAWFDGYYNDFSCTAIEGGNFLTCGHFFESGPTKIEVKYDGDYNPVTLIKWDKQADLAILKPTKPIKQTLKVAAASPQVGTKVQICSQYRNGFTTTIKERNMQYETLWVNTPFRQGESGGCILCNGEIVGVISCTDETEGLTVPAETVQRFLK